MRTASTPGYGRIPGSSAIPGAGSLGWNGMLRAAREQVSLSRPGTASRSGVSRDAIYSYESGRRRPSREQLLAITRALGIEHGRTNAMLELLSYEREPSDFALFLCGQPPRTSSAVHRHSRARTSLPEMHRQAATFGWPCFLLNERCELVGTNTQAMAVCRLQPGSIDDHATPLHLLEFVTTTEFRNAVLNWEEVVGALLPGSFKPFLNPATVSATPTAFDRALQSIRRRNPGALHELVAVWESRASADHSARVTFPLTWRTDDGTLLRFHCAASGWNTHDPVWVVDWHPADAETWEWFEAGMGVRQAD